MSKEKREELIAAIESVTSYPFSYYEKLTDDQLMALHEYHTL